jgi:hypothetical protein
MKESITKFDLEAAFKALDEIDVPSVKSGVRANKPALTEIFSRKSKFDALFEEYYDIDNSEGLSDAKEAREAEVAKAKLARIEKIVDLDAESPEDLLTSYVGKFIIQCPQCMTLFYKNPEDVENSEDDEAIVNVNEVCQHCGNESGYTLVGKVGEATPEEMDNFDTSELEVPEETEETQVDETEEASEETEAGEEDLEALDLEDIDLNIEDDETEANESFQTETHGSESLTEELTEDAEPEVSAEDFEKLIKSPEFQKPISDNDARAMMQELDETEDKENKEVSEALEEGIFDKIKNKFTNAIDKVTSSLKSREAKADWVLENAREDYNNIKANAQGQLVPDESNQRFHTFVVIGFTNKYSNGKTITMAPSFNNKDLIVGKNGMQEKKHYEDADNIAKGWSQTQGNGPAFIYLAKDKNDTNAVFLCEYFQGELENDQLEKYFNVVKKDLEGAKLMAKGGMAQDDDIEENSDTTATTENLDTIVSGLEELQESSLETLISDALIESQEDIANFRLTDCYYLNEELSVHGKILFTSGESKETVYTFTEACASDENKVILTGLNEKLDAQKKCVLSGIIEKDSKTFIAESFYYAK